MKSTSAKKAKNKSADQTRRFIEAARNLGTDESEEAFDRTLRMVAKAPPAPMHKADKGKTRTGKKVDASR